MHDLTYSVVRTCKENRDGSFSTISARKRTLVQAADQLQELGFKGMKQAKQLLSEGKTIRYVGATGPLQFDQWGDVSAPKLTWRFEGDQNVEIDYYSLEDVDALIKKLDG